MTGIIIAAVLLLLILLIFFVPYGICFSYTEQVLHLSLAVGPIRIKLLPPKAKSDRQLEKAKRRKEKKAAKKAKRKAEKDAAKEKQKTDETISLKPKKKTDISFILALLRMAVKAIRRFFHSFRINRLDLRYIVSSDDPFTAAEQYGMICGAVETLPVLAGNVIQVDHHDVEIGFDFTQSKPLIDLKLVVTLQLFRIVYLALAFGCEFLAWKIKKKKEIERNDCDGRQQNE